jgi:hypothetical protein
MRKRFGGAFDAVTKMGASFQVHERFRPLRGEGKPLWEFKEADHRLYCLRTVTGQSVVVVLLNGWSKDKEGISREEPRKIERAQGLLREMQQKGGTP